MLRRERRGSPEVGGPDAGQSVVELALVLPVVVMLALAVVQIGVVARDQLLVHHAAREAARRAAVEPTDVAARSGAIEATGLTPDRLAVTLIGDRSRGDLITARVEYRSPTDVPLAGVALDDVIVTAAVTMRVE